MDEEMNISTDIDFDKNGKQISFLNLPYSPHSDAWGVIPIPVAVIKNGAGPTVLLMGGIHGDEYEGPITLGRWLRELDPGEIQGIQEHFLRHMSEEEVRALHGALSKPLKAEHGNQKEVLDNLAATTTRGG